MFVWICSVKGHAVAAIDFLLVRWRRKAEKGAGSDAGEGASVRPPWAGSAAERGSNGRILAPPPRGASAARLKQPVSDGRGRRQIDRTK